MGQAGLRRIEGKGVAARPGSAFGPQSVLLFKIPFLSSIYVYNLQINLNLDDFYSQNKI
jgi:hypothetical protein